MMSSRAPRRSRKQPSKPQQDLELFPNQVDHYATMKAFFGSGKGSLFRDTSEGGLGKTEIQLFLSKDTGMSLFPIVTNQQMVIMWKARRDKYKDIPPFSGITTYGGIIGVVANGICNEPAGSRCTKRGKYMTRIDISKPYTEEQKEKIKKAKTPAERNLPHLVETIFELTDEMKTIIDEGVIIVLDECQKTKTSGTHTHNAMTAIIDYALREDCPSRVCMLSCTPMERPEQSIGFYRLSSMIKARNPYYGNSLETYKEGYVKETLISCYNINSLGNSLFDDILDEFDYKTDEDFNWNHDTKLPTLTGSSGVKPMLVKLLLDLIFPQITSAIDANQYSYVYRAFMDPDPFESSNGENKKKYSVVVNRMSQALATAEKDKVKGAEMFRIITKGLGDLEELTVDTACNFFLKKLIEIPTCKVVMFFSRKASLKKFLQFFSDKGYGVRTIHGNIKSAAKREKYREDFQKNKGVRVMGCTFGAGAEGLDLDDKIGDEPRYAGMTPTYSISKAHQVSRRFSRSNTKSLPQVYLLYCIGENNVTPFNIISNLYEKQQVLKKAIVKVNETRKFPGNYPIYIDDVGYVDDDAYITEEYKDVNISQIFSDMKEGCVQLVDPPMDYCHVEEDVLVEAKPNLPKGFKGHKQDVSLNRSVIATIENTSGDYDYEDSDEDEEI